MKDRVEDPLKNRRLGATAFFPGTSPDPRSRCKECLHIHITNGRHHRCYKFAELTGTPIMKVQTIKPSTKACKYFELTNAAR